MQRGCASLSGLLAAMSPERSVESNTTNALKMRGNRNAADRLTERRAVIRLMARSLQESGSKACVVKAWANNTVTALTVEGGF